MPPKKLRILCFGASLVAGYSSMGAISHPFSHNLVKMLRVAMPGTEIEAVVDGVPGDLVTRGKFLERMKTHFPEGSNPFDWTIVLGATNDIAYSIDPSEILDKFKEIWGIPLAHGSKVLALTVPRATVDDRYPNLVEYRNAVNDLIKNYKVDGFHVFDLHDALPCDAAHSKYWDDEIHFTPDGYNLIGDKLGVALIGLTLEDKTASS